MPEIKNNFMQGKMNKDLDERLIPNGQYRDAMNVEISTSEESSVGLVQNILGNSRVDSIVPRGFVSVGSIANEKTNRIYWFITTYEKDAILEYDTRTGRTVPVLVDLHASTSKAVLRFSGEIITGINIIDDLLFWTDNDSEPKKINIEECKRGTISNGAFSALNNHTQLEFERGSFNGITLELLGNHALTDDFTVIKQKKGKYFWYEKKQ